MTEPIKGFFGDNAFLSNFYKHEEIEWEGKKAKTVEHLFQAFKTNSIQERRKVLEAETPGEAKRLGRKVTMRLDWEEAKIGVMRNLLFMKFQIPRLQKKLLATGDAYLEETNNWGDHFWGANKNGYGQNWLGKLLMEVRLEICNHKK